MREAGIIICNKPDLVNHPSRLPTGKRGFIHMVHWHGTAKNYNRLSSDIEHSHSHKFLCFKETFKMSHLPEASEEKDSSLSKSPVKDSLIGAFTSLSKSLLTIL